jgi:hypothetical protein
MPMGLLFRREGIRLTMKAASKKYSRNNDETRQSVTGLVRSTPAKKITSTAMSIKQRCINTTLAGVRRVYIEDKHIAKNNLDRPDL